LFYHGKFRCGCPNPLLRVLPFLGLRRRVPLQGVRRLRRLPIPSPPPPPQLSMRRRARALPRPGLLRCPLCPPPRGLQTPTQQSSRTPRVRRKPLCWPAGCAMHKGVGLAYPILLAVEAAFLSRACTRSSSFSRASEGPRALPAFLGGGVKRPQLNKRVAVEVACAAASNSPLLCKHSLAVSWAVLRKGPIASRAGRFGVA